MQVTNILPAPLTPRDDRMQRTLTGLQEAYARQAARLKELAHTERRPAKPLGKRTYMRGALVKLKRAGNRK